MTVTDWLEFLPGWGKMGIVMNGEDILVHMLWANDLILMGISEIALQKQLDGLFKFASK